MKSVTDYLTPDVFDYSKMGEAMEQIKALPVPGHLKVQMLGAWARAVGAKVLPSQSAAVEKTGTDYR